MIKEYKQVSIKVFEYASIALITLNKNNDSLSKAVDSFKINDEYLKKLVDEYLKLLTTFKDF